MLITILGSPIPKARARVVNGHAYTPAATTAYARRVAWAAREAGIDETLWAAPLVVTCWFFMANRRRADLDNLIKAATDPLIGVVYKDDSQIVDIEAHKCLDRQNPRAVVEIEIANTD